LPRFGSEVFYVFFCVSVRKTGYCDVRVLVELCVFFFFGTSFCRNDNGCRYNVLCISHIIIMYVRVVNLLCGTTAIPCLLDDF